MSLPVIVLGAGGHACVVIDLLHKLGREVRGCVAPAEGPAAGLARYLGGDDVLDGLGPDAVELALGIGSVGDPSVRRAAFGRMRDRGFAFPALVHPAAAIGAHVRAGAGAQIMAGAVVQAGAVLSEGVIVNTAASVDHHALVGAFVHVAPGATICGDVVIEDGAHVGPGAVVCQGVRIGAGAVLAAGAVAVRGVAPGARVQGVPAKERSR